MTGEFPALPTAFDRLDPTYGTAWGISRASGPTHTDQADENAELRRENAALRRTVAALDQRLLELTRAAEGRDRGAVTTNDPRGPQPWTESQ